MLPTVTDTPTVQPTSTQAVVNPPTSIPTTTLALPTPLPTDTPTSAPALLPPEPNAPGVVPGELSGTLAFTILSSNPGVYVYRLSTGTSTLLPPGARQPNINPAGSVVARSSTGVAVRISLDGGNLRAVATGAVEAHPHWDVSGNAVILEAAENESAPLTLRLQNDAKVTKESKLLVGPNGSPLRGQFPVYLADGRIAFKGCDSWRNSSACGIYTISDNGTNPVQISEDANDIPTDNLGSQVLLMSRRAGTWDLYIADPNVRNSARPLVTAPSNEGLATASPDGQYMAFLTDREGGWAVYVARVDGAEPRKLFDLPPNAFGNSDWTQ